MQADWTPVLKSVLKQIKIRFIKEESEEEHKGPAVTTYKQVLDCFKDSIQIMLQKLKLEDREEIICSVKPNLKYFEQFKIDMGQLFEKI